jgi:hypothetical protein
MTSCPHLTADRCTVCQELTAARVELGYLRNQVDELHAHIHQLKIDAGWVRA